MRSSIKRLIITIKQRILNEIVLWLDHHCDELVNYISSSNNDS